MRLHGFGLGSGNKMTYAYDASSRVTRIDYYKRVGVSQWSLLGDITYTYDPAGYRVAAGGSWARTAQPPSLSAATYDAANQLTAWDGASLTYDLNGRVLSDGTRTYFWNARNQLTGVSGGGTSAVFAYDPLGRRVTKQANGSTIRYVYDKRNLSLELLQSGPVRFTITGLGPDGYFIRDDENGVNHILTDAIGSVVALTDVFGNAQTEYSYEPFGAGFSTGRTSSNPIQFAGRENDGPTGLYHYRARYYSPRWQRFISVDPLALEPRAEGVLSYALDADNNPYGYVANAPTMFVDPMGLTIHIYGHGGSIIAGTGIEGQWGRYLNDETGEEGYFLTVGTGVGFAVGADVFYGQIYRDHMDGLTFDLNEAFGTYSASQLFDDREGLAGWIFGGGIGYPGVSGTVDYTVTVCELNCERDANDDGNGPATVDDGGMGGRK